MQIYTWLVIASGKRGTSFPTFLVCCISTTWAIKYAASYLVHDHCSTCNNWECSSRLDDFAEGTRIHVSYIFTIHLIVSSKSEWAVSDVAVCLSLLLKCKDSAYSRRIYHWYLTTRYSFNFPCFTFEIIMLMIIMLIFIIFRWHTLYIHLIVTCACTILFVWQLSISRW